MKALDDGVYTVCGPSHGGWGREVNRASWREARVGKRAVLRVGERIDVLLSQRRTGKDRDFFKSAGVLLEEKRLLVVKSNQAHRASFDSVAASTIDLATPRGEHGGLHHPALPLPAPAPVADRPRLRLAAVNLAGVDLEVREEVTRERRQGGAHSAVVPGGRVELPTKGL